MKKSFIVLLFFLSITETSASIKNKIIQNLEITKNLTFNFEQNVNGKTQNGKCALSFPKKIFCKYNLSNQKILVSNGKSLVIKTLSSYYHYSLKKTPLNLILNKNFLLEKISNSEERNINDQFVNYNFIENENEINLFFDKNTFNLIGWQTIDIYQNISITYLSSIKRNQKLKENLFILPQQN